MATPVQLNPWGGSETMPRVECSRASEGGRPPVVVPTVERAAEIAKDVFINQIPLALSDSDVLRRAVQEQVSKFLLDAALTDLRHALARKAPGGACPIHGVRHEMDHQDMQRLSLQGMLDAMDSIVLDPMGRKGGGARHDYGSPLAGGFARADAARRAAVNGLAEQLYTTLRAAVQKVADLDLGEVPPPWLERLRGALRVCNDIERRAGVPRGVVGNPHNCGTR